MANGTLGRNDILNQTYQDSEGNTKMYPKVGQGPAIEASEDDLKRDTLGFTNLNLHRRIDPQPPIILEENRNQEISGRNYTLNIMNVHSYRTTKINVHDDESQYDETP